MGNLYQYFHAPDDTAALTALAEGPDDVGFATLEVKGVDPYLRLGHAEAALLGTELAQAQADPRATELLSDPEVGEVLVVTLTDRLRDALAEASSEHLAAVADVWARGPAFDPSPDPALLADFLTRLAALAETAHSRGHGLYCRIVL